MNADTKAAILQEIVDLVESHSALKDDEFTTEEFAAVRGINTNNAYHELCREVEHGNLEKRSVTIGGHVHCAWRKVVNCGSNDRIVASSGNKQGGVT